MRDEFLEDLDKEFDKHGGEWNFHEIAAYHHARAAINLDHEVVNLRRAINSTNEAIGKSDKTLEKAYSAVEKSLGKLTARIKAASDQSTKLGNKIVVLTVVLALAALFQVVLGAWQVYVFYLGGIKDAKVVEQLHQTTKTQDKKVRQSEQPTSSPTAPQSSSRP
ncbi:MAG: hypothetical protein K9K66_07640 [Desulfarculaceae bacterium]|nr:hypothetical protein [Desulfarculaceae bacterium]MCF8071997.1 hypothetical protein [Desulfarculaceae bacterium]MCF8101514.1 hypothetical protein [Desulfarculaceae bacterium]MCF8115064.1 hypothetical protein [Desulfarculaceae bacterium]